MKTTLQQLFDLTDAIADEILVMTDEEMDQELAEMGTSREQCRREIMEIWRKAELAVKSRQ